MAPLNTRTKKREAVVASVDFTIDSCAEKGVKLNIPKCSPGGAAGGSIKSALLDISVTGCAIESAYIIPPGATLCINIDPKPFLVEPGQERKDPMRFVGKVRSCSMKSAGLYRLGIQFIKAEKPDIELIAGFIATVDKRKAPRWNMTEGQ